VLLDALLNGEHLNAVPVHSQEGALRDVEDLEPLGHDPRDLQDDLAHLLWRREVTVWLLVEGGDDILLPHALLLLLDEEASHAVGDLDVLLDLLLVLLRLLHVVVALLHLFLNALLSDDHFRGFLGDAVLG